jgi:hypothetical protein
MTSESSLRKRCENLGFRRQGAYLDHTLHNSPEERSYLLVYLADVYQHLYPLNASLEVKILSTTDELLVLIKNTFS